jgi:dTDP-4-dehydrorhamnose 3,5-epimerase
MQITETNIEGIKLIHQFKAKDERGLFVKTFHHDVFTKSGIDFQLKESFYSQSHQGVIRGMHFHHPPFSHDKIVFCTDGEIIDVALDLRKQSKTYGQCFAQKLSSDNHLAMLIPKGFAHGFLTLSKNATTFYFVSGEYHQSADDGILFTSFGFDWQIEHPILSNRDLTFQTLANFHSPF